MTSRDELDSGSEAVSSKLGDDSPWKRWINRIIQVAIIALLIWQLTDVGWGEVIRNLPTNPFFYLLQFATYLALPLSELLIYRRPWKFKFSHGLPVFIYKKIYNSDVITYSGEFYLYHWARRTLGYPKKEVISIIRDTNILSTVSSTMIAVVLIAVFLSVGHIKLFDVIGLEGQYWLPWIALVVVILGIIAWRYRRLWFSMSQKEAAIISLIHIVRLLAVHALEMLQWIVAIPSVAITNWLSLMAAKIATNRIPLLPNKDLIFVSIVIGLSGTFGIPQAELASMLVVTSVMNKLMNVAFFGLISVLPEIKPPDIDEEDDEKDEVLKIELNADR